MKTNFTEMTDSQWQFVEKIIDNKRTRQHSLRTIVNSIFWITETGSQWRNMESNILPGKQFIIISDNLNSVESGRNCLIALLFSNAKGRKDNKLLVY